VSVAISYGEAKLKRMAITKKLGWIALTLALILVLTGAGHFWNRAIAAGEVTVQGSGATFPAPLYQRWFVEYNKEHPDVQINYQAIGSGAGIKQFQQGLTNFGASDAAMTDQQMEETKDGAVLIPMTAGIIVLTYNLPDLKQPLKLSRAAYTGIYLGKISRWSDPEIVKANPGVTLPDTKITTVSRSDGSGTTFVFTSHLSAVSDAWKTGPGAGTTVNFLVGVAGKGNPGVTALVKQTPGAIGYVEYAFAKQNSMPMACLENQSGKYIDPTLKSGQAALASVKLPANLRAWVTDPSAADAYPIVTYTWMLFHKKYQDPKMAETLKAIVNYGLDKGQSFSTELGYIPLPDSVISDDKNALNTIS
jgi:phosphate transport system substrate-binding protein